MKIAPGRKIFLAYALHLVLPALLVSEIFLHQIEKIHTEMAITNLDAQAAIQKARIQDMIDVYYQRILNITSREVLKKSLAEFWESGDVEQLVLMKKNLPNVKQPFSDFKEIFMTGRGIPSLQRKRPSGTLFPSTPVFLGRGASG